MGFLDGFRFQGHNQQGWVRNGGFDGKAGPAFFNANMTQYGGGQKGKPYKDDWDVDRAVAEGNDRVTWVFKSVYAIASNAARLPVGILDKDGDPVEHSLTPILNRKANPHHDAFNFRFQLSSQILLSKRGAFVEVVKDRLENVIGLYLLPPQYTYPVPDPKNFVSGFRVELPNQKPRTVNPENVVWVRIPHPTDPYRGQSPLESCGLAVDIDYYSRIYNRNFMVNDGRPGGILMVTGEMDDDTAEELRRRFLGNTGSAMGGAGRLTIMEAEQAKYIDTSMAQRDAQYTESKTLAKEEILMAFGVPESVIGNAADRTFSNADTELEVFWRETMLPHLMLIERALDRLDGSDELTVKFDVSDVAILSRDERERALFHLDEYKFGVISADEYRVLTGRDPVGSDLMFIQQNLMPVAIAPAEGTTPSREWPPTEPGSAFAQPTAATTPPADQPVPIIPEEASVGEFDAKAGEGVEEGKESAPLVDGRWGFHCGDVLIDQKEADVIRLHRDQQLTRLSESIAIQMTAYFQRQRRVVLEKWRSRKNREKINKGVAVTVNDVFDIPVWDRQLLADAKSFLMATVVDGGNDVAMMVGKDDLEMDDELVAAAVLAGLERFKDVNLTTRRKLESVIVKGLGSGASVDTVASDIEDVFNKSIKARAPMIGKTTVAFAVNEGQMIAALKSGFRYKVWLSSQDEKVRHTHVGADGQARPIMDYFLVGGSLMMHPGAQTAPLAETANCRCTMVFTNNPSAAGMLEFVVEPEDLASASAGGVIGRMSGGGQVADIVAAAASQLV